MLRSSLISSWKPTIESSPVSGFSSNGRDSPSEPMSVDGDSLQFGRCLTDLVSSRCPAAIAAVVGEYLSMSFIDGQRITAEGCYTPCVA